MTATDEHTLPATRKALDDAVHQLVGRQRHTIQRDDGPDVAWTASRYEQLADSVERQPGHERAGRGGSQAPIWVDAVDLRRTIDVQATEWRTRWHMKAAGTIGTLQALADHGWRPQDAAAVKVIADLCNRWAHAIDTLFDPPKRKELIAPCPACNIATVHRPDSTGEWVRTAALELNAETGCVCLNCRQLWPPSHFAHLARTLGVLPENVME